MTCHRTIYLSIHLSTVLKAWWSLALIVWQEVKDNSNDNSKDNSNDSSNDNSMDNWIMGYNNSCYGVSSNRSQ